MKKNSWAYFVLVSAVIGIGGLFIHGCGSGLGTSNANNANGATIAYMGTTTPGDVWNFSLNHTTNAFTATSDGGTAGTVAFTLGGTFATTNFGYLMLTITTVTPGAGTTPTIPIDGVQNIAYALEVPSVMLLVQPMGGSHLIAALYNQQNCNNLFTNQGGVLQPLAMDYIQVAFPNGSYDATKNSVYGYVQLTPTDATHAAISGENDYVLNTVSGNGFTSCSAAGLNGGGTGTICLKNQYSPTSLGPAISCAGGVVTGTSNGGAITGTVVGSNTVGGSAGAMVLDMGQGKGGLIAIGGVPNMTAATLSGLKFTGIVAKNNSGTTKPIQFTFDSTGNNITVNQITGSGVNLILGSALAFIKVNGYTNTGIVYASQCTDATFGTCTQGPVGGVIAQPTGANQKYVFMLAFEDGGTSAPGLVIAVQQ